MSALPDSFLGAAANDADAQETREWLDALSAVIATEGAATRALPARAADQRGAPGRHRRAVLGQHRVRQHHPDRSGRALPRQSRDRGAPARLHALERDGDGRQGESPASGRRRRPGRPHLDRSRRWRRCSAPASTTSGTPKAKGHGGDLLYIQGHSSPGIYARAYMEGRISEEQLLNFRQEVDGKGISSYPHPKLMPEFWQFPTVSMGLGPLMAHLPGALPQVPACARHRQHREPQGLGVLRRRRDGRARVARRDRPGGAREARQPDLRHQLQPAAPRRPGARQRQDHPGARRRVPRLRLERHQAAVGQLLGSAARARQGRRCCAR